jgi:probable selenium-dependent hydroxylase accessory protein YqeC
VGLLRELGLSQGGVLAAVGAGGKTSLLLGLARQAREAGMRVVLTSTTHMGRLGERTVGPLLLGDASDDAVEAALAEEGAATVLGRWVREDKLEGLPPDRVDRLAGFADLVLVEADGARGRSLKLPAPHEPVVPATAGRVVILAGLDAVGAPLDEGTVHRLPLVVAASGLREGDLLDADAVVRVLGAPEGYRSRAREGVSWGVFLNKAEGRGETGSSMARALRSWFGFAGWGSARTAEGTVLREDV